MEGHVSRECTQETKAKSCYKCGLEGHISRDCPDNAGGAPVGGGGDRSGGTGPECYRCGKAGHIARSCPEAASGGGNYGGGGSYGGGGFGGGQKTCYSCGGVGHLSEIASRDPSATIALKLATLVGIAPSPKRERVTLVGLKG
ncbi:hypothetical protein BD779DRAFT_1519338, partial [Infundibulicybe gibba]